jgi:hypothetical protein
LASPQTTDRLYIQLSLYLPPSPPPPPPSSSSPPLRPPTHTLSHTLTLEDLYREVKSFSSSENFSYTQRGKEVTRKLPQVLLPSHHPSPSLPSHHPSPSLPLTTPLPPSPLCLLGGSYSLTTHHYTTSPECGHPSIQATLQFQCGLPRTPEVWPLVPSPPGGLGKGRGL